MKHINLTIVALIVIVILSGMFYLANQEMVNHVSTTHVVVGAIAKILCVLMMIVTCIEYWTKASFKVMLRGFPSFLLAFGMLMLGACGSLYAVIHTSGVLMYILVGGGVSLTAYIAEGWGIDLLKATKELYS